MHASDGSRPSAEQGIRVFSTAGAAETPSPLRFETRNPPPSDRWRTATQYSRILVCGDDEHPLSLRHYAYGPGVLIPQHSYDDDEICFVLEGSLVIAGQELGPGDGIASAAHTLFAWEAGPDGVELLKFRGREDVAATFVD